MWAFSERLPRARLPIIGALLLMLLLRDPPTHLEEIPTVFDGIPTIVARDVDEFLNVVVADHFSIFPCDSCLTSSLPILVVQTQ
jgi:hypothetical protein